MTRLKHVIKIFEFAEPVRARLTLGPDTRLHAQEHRLQLIEDTNGFPTTPDLFVKTWLTTPRSLKRWVGFMADVQNFKNTKNVQITDVLYRLNDGTQDLYYNIGANTWVPASSNNWNSEIEIADNISTFPVSTQTIQVVLNLKSDDSRATPIVRAVRVLYESDLEEMEDYVWRSLLPDMRAKIRPIGDHHIETLVTGSAIDLNEFKIETPYDITAMDAVYDLDADPRKLTNLLDSFNDATQEISLTAPIPAGATVLIRFIYRPVFSVTTNQDYVELEKVPEVIMEDIKQVNDAYPVGRDFVLNKRTGEGKRVPATQNDIEIIGRFITNKAKDHARLTDAIKRYFRDNLLLRSVGMDDDFRLWLLGEYNQGTTASQKDLHTGRFRFRIASALFFDNDAVDIHGVLNFNLTTARTPC